MNRFSKYFLALILLVASPGLVLASSETVQEYVDESYLENEINEDQPFLDRYNLELETKYRVAHYLAYLEQNNTYDLLPEESLDVYNTELDNLYNFLNLRNQDYENLDVELLLEPLNSFITSEIEAFEFEELSEDNQKKVYDKVLAYMDGGIIFVKPILSENLSLDLQDKNDILLLIQAIEGSSNYYYANDNYKTAYNELLAKAYETYELTDLDEDNSTAELDEISEQIQAINNEINPTDDDLLDINTQSKFYKDPKYRQNYINLTKEQRDELDQMVNNIETKKPFLLIKQYKSLKKYGLPVYREDWAYPFMLDINENGMVGESYQEPVFKNDQALESAYRNITPEQRYIISLIDTNKNAYVEAQELDDSDYTLDTEHAWIINFMPKSETSEVAVDTSTDPAPLPETTTLDNTIIEEPTKDTEVTVTTTYTPPATQTIETVTPVQEPQRNDVTATNNVRTGVGSILPISTVLAVAGYSLKMIYKKK